MSFHHIVEADGFRFGGRRALSPPALASSLGPVRRRRGWIEWRTVALVAVAAILLVAMMART